ncbi:MAG: hypothetical protein HOP33_23445 [Verrucomicrobia bacterium]|nr:hypothetical protein [Verrucomicrobiota bacterium]
MASTFAVTRNHLIFGLCLPFAVLFGYLLADVNDPVSRFAIIATIAGLSFPLLMKWYHPIMIVCWNMTAQATFLPGAPKMWAFFSMLGIFFAVLNRSVNSENKFAHVPSLTLPILVFAGVILITAAMTGGVGFHSFGGSGWGGRNYFYILAAVFGFFALSSRAISPRQAYLFVALFYLPGIAAIFSQVALWIGPPANFVYYLFPGELPNDPFDSFQNYAIGEARIGGMMIASFAFFSWMLARYGVQGVFDLTRPWRLALFLGGIAAGFLGGFRSHLILVAITFGVLFMLERAWRTRAMLVVTAIGTLLAVFLVAFADKLPPTIQRSFSFLPIGIDPVIKVQAETSSQWRIDLWKQVVEEVPVYLFRGKGYNFSADEMYMAQYNQTFMGQAGAAQGAALAGDYHNGPLSLLIPFGIYGLLGFMWLIIAGSVYLYKTYRYGLPELKTINALLFASFLGKSIFFFTIFGALSNELYVFTGILGLSVALNAQKTPEPTPEDELALQT